MRFFSNFGIQKSILLMWIIYLLFFVKIGLTLISPADKYGILLAVVLQLVTVTIFMKFYGRDFKDAVIFMSLLAVGLVIFWHYSFDLFDSRSWIPVVFGVSPVASFFLLFLRRLVISKPFSSKLKLIQVLVLVSASNFFIGLFAFYYFYWWYL